MATHIQVKSKKNGCTNPRLPHLIEGTGIVCGLQPMLLFTECLSLICVCLLLLSYNVQTNEQFTILL